MAIRVLLTPLFHSTEDRRALHTALLLAKRFQGHVDALLVQPDPMETVPLVGEGISADTIRELMATAAAVMEQQRQATKTVFDDTAAAAGIADVDQAGRPVDRPSAAFRAVTGRCEDVVPECALFSDLVVFGGARSDMAPGLRPTFEAVLLKSRRPILLAPATPCEAIGHNVAIAWNGTPEARNALAAAMPFLDEAVAVHLLTVASARTEPDHLDGTRDYLAWHGIASESHVIEASDLPVGAALMREATAIGADLLVMGGYGHNRLRERILGGVTHHIANQPDLPILLAH